VNEVLKAAHHLQSFCEAKNWKFCIIGGLALLRWGEPRETVDVDVTLLTGFGAEHAFIETILQRYQPRIENAAEFALQHRVLLVRSDAGVGLDIALGALPFEASAIERSSKFRFLPEIELRTCSAEDLVVFKAFAARPKDWIDIDGVLIRQIDQTQRVQRIKTREC
jgi:hypothetical protein